MAYISLRSIREQKGLTIAQLAGKTSLSIRTLQAYESGDRSVAPDDLRKLARVLNVTAAEILQPGEPPAAPTPPVAPPEPKPAPVPVVPPIVSESESPTSTPRQPPPAEPIGEVHHFPPRVPSSSGPVHQPFDRTVERGPRRPFGAAATVPRVAAPRPPRPSRPAPPPAAATVGQLDQIRNLARRMGLEEAELVERIGSPLDALDFATARAAITKLRTAMEESGTWRPRVGEGPDQEGEYLAKLRQSAMPVEVLLFGGERVRGLIDDFTPYVIQIRQSDGSEVTVRKLAVVYYRTLEAVDDPR